MQHMNEPAPDVRVLRPDVKPRLAGVVARALEKDPGRRFPSMEDLCAELGACLDELGPEADEDATMIVAPGAARAAVPAPAYAPAPAPRRRPGVRPLFLALMLLLGAAAAAVYFVTRDSSSGKPPARGSVVPLAKKVHLRGVGAFDPPPGDGSEHNGEVGNATDGDPATYWETEHYRSFDKPGVGLVLDAGKRVRLGGLTVFTDTPGFTAVVKAGDSRDPSGFVRVSSPRYVGGTTRFPLRGGPHRYYLLWITKLPPSGNAHVNEVRTG
jgi:hypothetical protein